MGPMIGTGGMALRVFGKGWGGGLSILRRGRLGLETRQGFVACPGANEMQTNGADCGGTGRHGTARGPNGAARNGPSRHRTTPGRRLITQRSLVQIQPAQLVKAQVKGHVASIARSDRILQTENPARFGDPRVRKIPGRCPCRTLWVPRAENPECATNPQVKGLATVAANHLQTRDGTGSLGSGRSCQALSSRASSRIPAAAGSASELGGLPSLL